MTLERRRREFDLLARLVPGLRHGPDFDWIIAPAVPLPPGWNKASVDVLFYFPGGYPETCFDNFYVERGLALAAGSNPGAFNVEGRSLDGKTWDMFSWHHEEGWRPKPRVEDGSNVLDWWRSIQKRLAEAN